jgi:hypothetical protein
MLSLIVFNQGTDNIVAEIFSPGSSGIVMVPGLCGNSSCDMALGDFTVNWWRQRFPHARFSTPWMLSGYQILARQWPEDPYTAALDFISPFELSLWGTIFGMLTGFSLMVIMIESASLRKAAMRLLRGSRSQENETSDECRDHSAMDFAEGFWFGFQTLFSTQDNGALETKMARVMVWFWQFSVIVFISAYTATYTTILASDQREWVIGSVLGKSENAYTTLGAAVQACPLCISTQKGGAGQTYLNGTLRMDFSKVQDEKAAPFPLASASSRIQKIKALMEEGSMRSVWVEKSPAMKYIMGRVMSQATDKDKICYWKAVGAEFGVSAQAIPFAPSLPDSTADAIDGILSDLTEDLSLESLKNQWFQDWPDCLLIKDSPWRSMTPQDFIILFALVSLVAILGFVYRLIADYSLIVQMNPEGHSGALASFIKTKLGKLIFGVEIKELDKAYSSHAILCDVKSSLKQVMGSLRAESSNGARKEDSASSGWVRKYSNKKGIHFYVNEITGQYSWNGPETALHTVKTGTFYNMADFEGFDKRNIWVCDIKEKAGETDNDFLFCAHIDNDGLAGSKGQYCVFQNVIYDINSFTEDSIPDGSIDFGIHFGRNTAEKSMTPNGWTIHCKVRRVIKNGFAQYTGKIMTSWWGERDVAILRYAALSAAELRKYPDLVSSNYYKSRA